MTTTHDPVNHPRHYTAHPSGIEAIEITRHMGFNLGNAVKYVMRAEHKNGTEDLRKALWYLNDHLGYHGGYQTTISHGAAKRLYALTTHEPDELRRDFYRAMEVGDVITARNKVEDMLQS